ncbi:hypothetical protein JXB11_04170 [Candidatus Woesearchaeota archaeon]|nr:hypothetical protein [Candidatus Woesearchaeota archaeon]
MLTIQIPHLEVVYRQTFVLQPLYRIMRKWLMENEYVDEQEDTSMESAMEILYLERRGTAQKANEKEWRIWWRAQKPIAGNVRSKYYTYHLDVDFNVIQTVDMEVMREGKKELVQFGEMRITLMPYLEVGEIVGHPLLKYIDYFFRSRIIKKNLEEHKKLLYQDAYRFQAMIKKWLELKSFLPEKEYLHRKFEFV